MWEIKPFHPDDILHIRSREPDRTIAASLPNATDAARGFAASGPCWTGFFNSTPVVCAGFVILWPGVAEGWAMTSDWCRDHPVIFHKAATRQINNMVHSHSLWRLQLAIPVSHRVSCAWAKRMGFVLEGVMLKYGPDQADYFRYVRLT